MKDYFSFSPEHYAKYRPDYPAAIFDFIYPLLNDKSVAWDCGTGNGQLVRVEATDISSQQLEHAFATENINYTIQPAEKTNFPDNSFDLITVAQAVHWFDIDKFNEEVKRVGKPNSIIAMIGYELNNITLEIDAVIRYFYKNIIGEYWDAERKHLENRYQHIAFPFRELETPAIQNIKLWKFEHLLGYLNTCSAVQHYKDKNNTNPIDLIHEDLQKAWGSAEVRRVIFPIIFRVGRVK